MTTALEGDEGSASRQGRSLPPWKTRYPLYRRLGGPQGRSGQVRKISPQPRFDPRIVQPVASRYTDYATRLTIFYWKRVHNYLRKRGGANYFKCWLVRRLQYLDLVIFIWKQACSQGRMTNKCCQTIVVDRIEETNTVKFWYRPKSGRSRPKNWQIAIDCLSRPVQVIVPRRDGKSKRHLNTPENCLQCKLRWYCSTHTDAEVLETSWPWCKSWRRHNTQTQPASSWTT